MLACEGVVYSTEEAMCTILYETTLPHCCVTFRTADFGITNKAAKKTAQKDLRTLQGWHVRLGEANPLGWSSSGLEASAIRLGHLVDLCIPTNNNEPRCELLDQKKTRYTFKVRHIAQFF